MGDIGGLQVVVAVVAVAAVVAVDGEGDGEEERAQKVLKKQPMNQKNQSSKLVEYK